MFDQLEVFRTAHSMAVHAGARHALAARNIANADTPGYRARDIPPFHEVAAGTTGSLRTTRPGHIGADPGAARAQPAERAGALSDPNGNSVSLELEMLTAVEARRQHDRALAIYRNALSLMRLSLGRR